MLIYYRKEEKARQCPSFNCHMENTEFSGTIYLPEVRLFRKVLWTWYLERKGCAVLYAAPQQALKVFKEAAVMLALKKKKSFIFFHKGELL